MGFLLDRRSRLTYSAQVQLQALAQLFAGRLSPGDRLPSVRELARELAISRTTAERIHEALCDALFAEVRPRSGAFVATPEPVAGAEWARAVRDLLNDTVMRARGLGLATDRLCHLLDAFASDDSQPLRTESVLFPVVATRDAFECMVDCLDDRFPGRFFHIPPDATAVSLPRRCRFLLSGYFLREKAQEVSRQLGCKVLNIRYNVKLLDRVMAIDASEHRHVLTRDDDNAETTRAFLASAYPEVDASRYTVASVQTWLRDAAAIRGTGQVWATTTALPYLTGRLTTSRITKFHPTLDAEFVEELRCLALFS